MVDVFDGVIHMFGVIAFVSDEDAFLKRDTPAALTMAYRDFGYASVFEGESLYRYGGGFF